MTTALNNHCSLEVQAIVKCDFYACHIANPVLGLGYFVLLNGSSSCTSSNESSTSTQVISSRQIMKIELLK